VGLVPRSADELSRFLAEDAAADLTLSFDPEGGSKTPTSASSAATGASVPDTSTSSEVTAEFQPDATRTEASNAWPASQANS
jgi:hypothetical protein